MPQFENGTTTIHYEEHGSGFPLLLFAPGAMNSTVERWAAATLNPLEVLGEGFRMIAMDQRNAGRSRGPLDVEDPWGSFAADQLGLLDHLGVEECHVMGCCIGGSYALRLIELAPARVSAAVLEQPIGVMDRNRHLFEALWRDWGEDLAGRRADIDASQVEQFGTRMWDGEFVVSVSRGFISSCSTPMLVLPGIDDHHPTETGRELAALAPRGEVFEPWKDTPEHTARGVEVVRQFLVAHTPARPAPGPVGP
ncbi:MAG TPA: alpha/beta hydrolase [Solirubrobacteraceae bacterium]|jgi:pimeloyl-ACP methyl ester carboxylesterase